MINVQGDEPFIEPALIDELVTSLKNSDAVMVSAMHKIKAVKDLENPNVVKVTINNQKEAIYFSRSIIPHPRDELINLLKECQKIPKTLTFFRHLGIYGYKRDFLQHYCQMEMGYLESVEKLEQLRVIENGYKIQMVETHYNSIGIDTQEDYEKALEIVNQAID